MVPDEYEVWLFDLDGTLVDAEWTYVREVFDRVGDRLGRRFTDHQAEVLWHGLEGRRDGKLREWGMDPEAFWPAFHGVEDPASRAAASYLHKDAERLVRQINAQGRPTGIVTHCASFLAWPVVSNLGIEDWFDVILPCSNETGWKPDPAPIYQALGEIETVTGTPSDSTAGLDGVFVGDGSNDVGAAWNAGLDAIHIERHGHERRRRCVLADHRVTSFDELPRSSEAASVRCPGSVADE